MVDHSQQVKALACPHSPFPSAHCSCESTWACLELHWDSLTTTSFLLCPQILEQTYSLLPVHPNLSEVPAQKATGWGYCPLCPFPLGPPPHPIPLGTPLVRTICIYDFPALSLKHPAFCEQLLPLYSTPLTLLALLNPPPLPHWAVRAL